MIGQAHILIVGHKTNLQSTSTQHMTLTLDMTNLRIFTLKFTQIRKTRKSLGLETPQRSLSTMVQICSPQQLDLLSTELALNGTQPTSTFALNLSIPSTTEDMTLSCKLCIMLKTPSLDSVKLLLASCSQSMSTLPSLLTPSRKLSIPSLTLWTFQRQTTRFNPLSPSVI